MPAMASFTAPARASAFAGRKLRAAATNGSSTTMFLPQPATGKALWLPGADTPRLNPSYLDGSYPGDYGFDPLGLAEEGGLPRLAEAELIHCRWAMLGAAGVIAVEALGFGDWVSAQTAVPQTYFGVVVPWAGENQNTISAVFALALAFSEAARQSNTDAAKRLYPGGPFNPLNFPATPEAKLKEISNGRLAMLACAGFAGQAYSTGTTPLANLAAHVADPFHNSVAQNAVALPYL